MNVLSARCLHQLCMRQPTFNVDGSTKAAYCKEHAKDGMVDIYRKRCSTHPCTTTPYFNVESSNKEPTAENMPRTAW